MNKVIVLLVITVLASGVVAQSTNGFQLFEFVASVLQSDYINPKGVNLDKTVASYAAQLGQACPQIANCPLETGRDVATRMLRSFDDAHLTLINSSTEPNTRVGAANSSGRFGFFLEQTPTGLYVGDVYPDTPVERAGIRRGDRIIAVNGANPTSPTELEKSLRTGERSLSETRVEYARNDQRFTAVLRANFSGTFFPVLDRITQDTYRIRVYALGAVYIDQAVHSLIAQINKNNGKNVVLDLRYNSGGVSPTSMKVAAAFIQPPERIVVTKEGERYRWRYANGETEWNNLADPTDRGVFEGKLERPQRFDGRVAVLTSSRTYSAGEHLAYIIQATKRGQVFGAATAGALDTSATSKRFGNNDDLMFFGASVYQNLDGTVFPRRVMPDVKVENPTSGYVSGRDTVLEAAVSDLQNP